MLRTSPPPQTIAPTAPRAGRPGGAGIVLLAAFLGWMFDGLEMGIFPLAARPALQQMMDTTNDAIVGPWVGYITASFLLGAAAGGLLFGWLGDRIGRVRSMSLSVLCYSLFTGAGFFAAAPWHLLVLRFIAALGMGGEWSLGVALVMECWPENRRPLLAGLIGAASNVGFALIAVLGMVFKVTPQSWRWVMLAGIAPAALTFFIRLFVPESEKWKRSVAASGPGRPLREVLSPPLLKVTALAVAFASIALIGTWGSIQWIPTWVDKLTAGKLPHAKAASQVVSSLGAVVGGFAGALLAGWWGRRVTYFGLCLLSLSLCAALFRGFHTYSSGLLVVVFLVGTVTAAFYGWLPLYLPELFPTRMRATGQGLGYNLGRVFAAVGALEAGTLVNHYGGSYARSGATITLIYAAGLVLIWLAPETKGKPLPE
ncbi:MAG: naiP [Phycisphaerales bacterium]|nr:naiP [Phycisphaerales bacterium]